MRFLNDPKGSSLDFRVFFEEVVKSVDCDNRTQIACRNGYQCVDRNNSCDGFTLCDDGTDQQNCRYTEDQLKFISCGKPVITPDEYLNDFRIVGGKAAKPGEECIHYLLSC